MTWNDVQSAITSPRALQLAARYIATGLVAVGGINAERSSSLASILAPFAVSMLLIGLDHALHGTSMGRQILDRLGGVTPAEIRATVDMVAEHHEAIGEIVGDVSANKDAIASTQKDVEQIQRVVPVVARTNGTVHT